MRSLASKPGVRVDGMFGVYCGDRTYRFGGVTVLPVADFIQALFKGDVF